MSTLQARLDRIRAGFEQQAPAEALAVIERATVDLRASGILDSISKTGDPLPAFELADTEGVQVSSADPLAAGPLVVTVYRGLW